MKIRNFIYSLIPLMALMLLFSESLSAQGFNSITSSDGINVLAVGNSGKLYRSGNGGVSYSSSNVSGNPDLNSVTSLGTDAWIAGESGNVYKTMMTSSPINTYNVGSGSNLNSIKFINANTGFVCGDGGALYKTVNGGINWSLSNTGISPVNLNSLDFSDNNNGTVVGALGNTFYTTDGGATWTNEASGSVRNLLKVRYFGSDKYAVGEWGTIIKNTGSGWTTISSKTKNDITGLTGTLSNDIHISGGGGFIRNNKSGSSNFFNFEANPMLADLKDIFYYDNNKGWAVSSKNAVIIYTSNGGSTWNMPNGSSVAFNWVSKPGASGSFLGNNLCQNPADRNSFFVAFGNKVYVSRDRGESWSQVGNTYPGSTTPHSFFVSPLDTNIWLVANQASGGDIVARTTNYGSTWTTVLTKNFSNYGQPLEIDQNNPSVFYFAPDGGGFWKSTNSGASFTEISGNFPFRSPCEILVTWDSSEVIILGDGVTGNARAVMFKSTNGGVNWTSVDTANSSETPSMCNTAFDNNIVWCTEWSGSNIYKSIDMGSSFSIHRSTGFSGWGSDVCREDPTMVITGSWGAAATLSTNGGTNWTNINTGLSGHGGGIFIVERGLVLAQQGSNVYKLNITYTDNPVVAAIDVQAFSLNGIGDQYYTDVTINPTGTVKNNNGAASATFTVTRTISPGGYTSTKNVVNLISDGTTIVTFDPWTFEPGTNYTVRDSVYIFDDINPANDVISGSLTPHLGEGITRIDEPFVGSYPPKNWTLNYTGTVRWIYSSVSAYNIGTGSSEFNFWNATAGTNQSMLTPDFPASVEGDSLKYDYSYAPYTNGTVDSLIIEYSTNGGSSYSELARFQGKNTDVIGAEYTMVTTSPSGNQYSPTQANQWLSRSIALPVGTNKIKYRARSGYGNNLYVDNINVSTFKVYTLYNVKLSPEGFYNGVNQNMSDTITVYLRNNLSPFGIADSASAVIDSVSNNAALVFKNISSGTYYIQTSHRNSLETWSKSGGESVTAGVTGNYDFTTASSQAYGNNLNLNSGLYCLYGGDINKDGLIELSDLIQIYNDGANFAFGYVLTDLTGDGLVDLSDLLIVYNNASNFVSKNTPESAPSPNDASKERSRKELLNYFSKNSKSTGSK